ncbi:MAG: hypothetical protein WBE34_13080 [Candidatus Nitrosopolaris sp.]
MDQTLDLFCQNIGQHVRVTGRYLIEMPEMPGGITELHPVYAIKILP